jgi:hypothetical protein
MVSRKPSWWWDWSWNPVGGCKPPTNSPGCAHCWVPKWLKSHTWKTETVHTGVTKANACGRRKWTGDLTALRDGDPMWTLPLTHPGVANPALGPRKPNLIFTVLEGDLFVEGRAKEDKTGCV